MRSGKLSDKGYMIEETNQATWKVQHDKNLSTKIVGKL